MRIAAVTGGDSVSLYRGDDATCWSRSRSRIASRPHLETAEHEARHGLRDPRSRSISRTRRTRSIVVAELVRVALSIAASLRRSWALSAWSASSASSIRVMRARRAAFCSTSVCRAWSSEADSTPFCLFGCTVGPLRLGAQSTGRRPPTAPPRRSSRGSRSGPDDRGRRRRRGWPCTRPSPSWRRGQTSSISR